MLNTSLIQGESRSKKLLFSALLCFLAGAVLGQPETQYAEYIDEACSEPYTAAGVCDGWARTSKEECIERCKNNETPDPVQCPVPEEGCKHSITYTNGWCHLEGNRCRRKPYNEANITRIVKAVELERKSVARDTFIAVDLVYKALDFKTDAAIGSNKKTIIDLFTHGDETDQAQLQLLFGDRITLRIKSCTGDGAGEPGQDLDRAPAGSGSIRIWRVVLEVDVLKMWCNDKLVLSYRFADSQTSGCQSLYGDNDFVRMKFGTEDTATVSYSSLEGCPWTHPNAYAGGLNCCQSNLESFYEPSGHTCDGSVIQLDSTCCKGDQYVACPTGRCTNFGSKLQSRALFLFVEEEEEDRYYCTHEIL
ncbi:hypothetical protein ACHWQZ_G001319 [Mnemiopsis leidyi]